jgi:regulatory protein
VAARGGGEGGKDGRPRAYDAAVRLLAPRALTVHEVRTRLARRGYPSVDADEAIATLLERGYLDDRALAYNVATILAERRLFGKPRVAAELARRGVAAAAIGDAVERAFAGLDEDAMALRAAARGGRGLPDDERGRERMARALLRRGFSRGAVARVLRGAGQESDDSGHDHEFEADS